MPNITSEELNTRISDEITTHALREAISKATAPKQQSTWAWSRHPLFLTVAGFIFTGVIGVGLEWLVDDSAKTAAEREASIAQAHSTENRAREALFDLMTLTNERATRARLLRSGMTRGAESVPDRMDDYQVAYAAWNVDLDAILFRIREALAVDPNQVTKKHPFEILIAEHVDYKRTAAFPRSDLCLTRAFDKFSSGGRMSESVCGENWHRDVIDEVRRATDCVGSIVAAGLREARFNNERAVAIASGKVPPARPPEADPEEAPEKVCPR